MVSRQSFLEKISNKNGHIHKIYLLLTMIDTHLKDALIVKRVMAGCSKSLLILF
jgi:hypothetical protein